MLRFSIARMMVLVGFVALNIAAARALFVYDGELLVGVVLGVLMLEVAVLRLVRSRGRKRAFWAGFIACGLMAMMTLVWARVFPDVIGIGLLGGVQSRIEVSGSPLFTIWYGYASIVSEPLTAVIDFWEIDPEASGVGAVLVGVAIAIIWFLPRLVMAVVGGLVGRSIAARLDGERRGVSVMSSSPGRCALCRLSDGARGRGWARRCFRVR